MKFTSTSGYAKLDHVGETDWQLLGTERRPDDVASKVLYQEFQLNAALFGGGVDLVTGLNYFQEEANSSGFAAESSRHRARSAPRAARRTATAMVGCSSRAANDVFRSPRPTAGSTARRGTPRRS